ncbi:hypothetical protein ABW20_dc0107918 [Dactylellina cionopaga]|nr:hypothetical protein ABW20_dc0107918 [Dactylellina cionopaga]
MSNDTSTTAAKASGITPTTALPSSGGSDEQFSSKKSNLPASNPVPLPESPAYTPSDSVYPPPAEPVSRPPIPTSTANNLTEMLPADNLASLDGDTAPTRTTHTTVNLTDPPAPQPGAVPVPTSTSQTKKDPSAPRPGATPSLPAQTAAAVVTASSIPAPSFTMPPVQTTYGSPEVTMRGQPIAGYTSTASSTSYNNYPSAIRRGSEVAQAPGGYQQRDNNEIRLPGEGPRREDGILGKVSKAVDQFNEWMVGEGK